MTEAILTVLGVGVVVFFLFARYGRELRLAAEGRAASRLTTQAAAELPSPPTLSPEELELRRVREVRDQIAAEAKAAHDARNAETKDARDKIAKATELLRESGLASIVPALIEEIRHWPSWSKMPDRWKCPVELTGLEGESSSTASWVQWRWQDILFRIKFDEPPSYGFSDSNLSFADIAVQVDGAEVLAISVCRDVVKEYDNWRFTSLKALRVGPWMAALMDFWRVVKLAKEARMAQRGVDDAKSRAARIDLGD